MISMVGKGCSWSVFNKAVSQSVGGRMILPPLASYLNNDEKRHEHEPSLVPHFAQLEPYHVDLPPKPKALTVDSLSKSLITRNLKFQGGGVGVGHQVRMAHTDIQIPNFDGYRRPSTKDPFKKNEDSIDTRRVFTYVITAGFGAGMAIASKSVVQTCVLSLAATKDVLALAKIEVKLNEIPEGKNVVFKWRGKPLFVRHRTAEEIARERAIDVGQLRDPQSDEERCPTGKWLIVLGICTHLGCVPIANQGDYYGYYCPCHGSHYDASGRVRKGPAPLNLEIPEHVFDGDVLTVG